MPSKDIQYPEYISTYTIFIYFAWSLINCSVNLDVWFKIFTLSNIELVRVYAKVWAFNKPNYSKIGKNN